MCCFCCRSLCIGLTFFCLGHEPQETVPFASSYEFCLFVFFRLSCHIKLSAVCDKCQESILFFVDFYA